MTGMGVICLNTGTSSWRRAARSTPRHARDY